MENRSEALRRYEMPEFGFGASDLVTLCHVCNKSQMQTIVIW